MGEYRANLRAEGHPDIVATVSDNLDSISDWLPAYFTEEVRRGVRFMDGQTVQIGWAILKLFAQDELLVVTEPDFVSMPIKWVVGANSSMRFLSLQRAVCDAVEVSPDFPSFAQPIWTPPARFGRDFSMERFEADSGHSGWQIWDSSEDCASLDLVSFYEASLVNKAIVPFAALPVGAVVTRTDQQLSISLAGREISSHSNQFLADLNRAGV